MRTQAITVRASLLAILAAIATSSFIGAVSGAEPVRENRAVAGFSRIEIEGLAEVTLVQGATEGVTIEASADVLPRIETTVRDKTLIIVASDQRHWWQWFTGASRAHTPRVTINLRQVERIEAAGAVKIVADTLRADALRFDLAGACSVKIGDLQAKKLRLDGAGAVKAEISGTVGEQDIDLSGAGSYRAARLVSEKAVVQVSGAGKAIVHATTTLKVDISGAAAVEYLGDPKIQRSISGVGRIKRRENA